MTKRSKRCNSVSVSASAPPPVAPLMAAAYVRMSTEHQKYSIATQLKKLGEYAELHGLEICKIYEDAGKSGLTLERRNGLTQLIEDVQTGNAAFHHVLIYDISRWGRFQDPDESAYYEFICRRNGVSVTYCAEPFENDRTPLSVILKNIKRTMAGEFSRELSAKIFSAQSIITKQGQVPGGMCPYGLARLSVDPTGKRRKLVKRGHRREVKSDVLIHAPGPKHEIMIVREIFDLSGNHNWSGGRIAKHLNEKGCVSPNGSNWTYQTVLYMLHNDKYIGTQFYNRTSCKLLGKRTRNDPSQWVQKLEAFPPIVDPELFSRVQKRFEKPWRRYTDKELLSKLRKHLKRHGRFKVRAMRAAGGMASPQAYLDHFGTVRKACELAGYPTPANYLAYDRGMRLRKIRIDVLSRMAEAATAKQKKAIAFTDTGRHFRIDDSTGYCDARPIFRTNKTGPVWRFSFPDRDKLDLFLIIRVDVNERPIDFFVIPAHAASKGTRVIGRDAAEFRKYRYASSAQLTHAIKGVMRGC